MTKKSPEEHSRTQRISRFRRTPGKFSLPASSHINMDSQRAIQYIVDKNSSVEREGIDWSVYRSETPRLARNCQRDSCSHSGYWGSVPLVRQSSSEHSAPPPAAASGISLTVKSSFEAAEQRSATTAVQALKRLLLRSPAPLSELSAAALHSAPGGEPGFSRHDSACL